ncbi:DUF6253 family protein [Kitasatospora sp. NPDC096147]|uniref:DUF6253 family protein n=1 Tax=Kitasatospora sp. NPDC096147 TaxID=3364093 RepID=UPI00382E0A11
MSLLDAQTFEAVFGTPEGDTYRVPLVCWREDGEHVHGLALIKGHLRRVDRLPQFLRYAERREGHRSAAVAATTVGTLAAVRPLSEARLP